MKRFGLYMLALIAAFGMGMSSSQAAVNVGDSVSEISFTDINGTEHSFADFAGKTVVVEWNNQGCPFVRKFYKNGDMQSFQKAATAKDVVWVTINSSAEGKEGYIATADEAKAMVAEKGIMSTAYALDPKGDLGHTFGAKVTPHMFVIDATGTVAYQGAIDSKPSADPADIATADNYVMAAIDAIAAGQAVATPVTQPYGCSVKYGNAPDHHAKEKMMEHKKDVMAPVKEMMETK